MVIVKFNGYAPLDNLLIYRTLEVIGTLEKVTKNKIIIKGKMIKPYKQLNDSYYEVSRLDLIEIKKYYE